MTARPWLVALSFAPAALGAAPQSQTLLTFRATTTVVSVPASVQCGRFPAPGLTAADFEVLDEGVRQRIESMSTESVPIDVTLAIDTSSSVIADFPAFKLEVQRFAAMLRPVDRLRVVSFATGVYEVAPMRAATSDLNLDALVPGGWTSSNDGLIYALLWPTDPDRQHLVIALTDGIDSHSTLGAATLVEIASRVRAVFHVVLVAGVGVPASQWERGARDAVVDVATQSGGAVHELGRASSDFKRIFDDFRASYVLRYMPEGVARDGWHDLSVKLLVRDASRCTIRARRGYWGSAP